MTRSATSSALAVHSIRALVLAPVVVLALAGDARADAAHDLQVAQALYDEAARDLAAKNYDAACPKLEEAARLTPEGVGVRLTLALCYEGQGRLASAYAAYQIAESLAVRARRQEQQRTARAGAAALAPRLAKLRIVVSNEAGALPGLEIRRKGSLVGAAQWGLPLPADRGKHVVEVTAADGRKWEASAVIERDGTQVDLLVEVPPAVRPPIATPAPLRPEPTPAAPMSPRRVAGIAVGAAGLAAIVTGAALGITAVVKKNQSVGPGRCDDADHCSTAGSDLRWASLRAGDWSTALFIGGGVALAGGIVLFATAPSAAEKPAAARLVVGPRGLSLTGAW